MRQLTSWHYLALLSLPLGIYLGLQFGLLGLALFTVMNLTLCHFCPDSFLFQKRPDAVHRFSKKQFYSGRNSGLVFSSLALLSPLVAMLIVWVFPLRDIAGFILSWADYGIINENMETTAAYISDASLVTENVSASTLERLEYMNKRFPGAAIYTVLSLIIIQLCAPIVITTTTFDRIRAARSGHTFRASRKIPVLKYLLFSLIFLALSAWTFYLCSAPYTIFRNSRGIMALIVAPTMVSFTLWGALLILDNFISRPQSCQYEHATDHELYLERRRALEIKPPTVSR